MCDLTYEYVVIEPETRQEHNKDPVDLDSIATDPISPRGGRRRESGLLYSLSEVTVIVVR